MGHYDGGYSYDYETKLKRKLEIAKNNLIKLEETRKSIESMIYDKIMTNRHLDSIDNAINELLVFIFNNEKT